MSVDPTSEWARVKAIAGPALDLEMAERRGFVTERCGADADLLAAVLAFLDAHQRVADEFLEDDALAHVELDVPHEDVLVGRRIGSFSVENLIATGGMGAVYRAVQDRTGQTVALKVLRSGLVSDSMRIRFEHEVRILAQLQHPAIAQIFDAGVYDDGRGHDLPYFAMEFVSGLPLTGFCREKALDQRQIVALMIRVCEGVHHAHQRGVIHRDLKPDNIFVIDTEAVTGDQSDTGLASVGQPKILDFGVARVAGSGERGAAPLTQVGQLIGTMSYMSPEQVSGDPDDIDVRSDVYALGVILFQALTGRKPFDLAGVTVSEAIRTIEEVEAPRLSSVDRAVASDLDTIVSVALEKDPERRYASASELGADLRRFLDDEIIAARPASAIYQLRKFARRHRGLVAGLGLAVVTLVLGAAGTIWGLLEALDQRDRARSAERDAADVTDFLADMVASADTAVAGRSMTVLELLDANAPRIQSTFPDKPSVRARLFSAVGWDYCTLGAYAKAERYLRLATELLEAELGRDHGETIQERARLVHALIMLNRLDAVAAVIDELVATAQTALGAEHAATLQARSVRGSFLHARGRPREAAAVFREIVPKHVEVFGRNHEATLTTMSRLGNVLQELGELDEAREIYRAIYEMRRAVYGDAHARSVVAAINLAGSLSDADDHDAAAELYQRALELGNEVWTPEHPTLRDLYGNYASALQAARKLEESLAMHRRTYALRREFEGPEHPDTLLALNNLCVNLLELNRIGEAIELTDELVTTAARTHGRDHIQTARFLNTRVDALALGLDSGSEHRPDRIEQCRRGYRRSITIHERQLGARHPSTVILRNSYAVFLLKRVDAAAAARELRRVVADWTAAVRADASVLRVFRDNLVRALIERGEFEAAERELRLAWELPAHAKASDAQLRARFVQLYEAWGKPGLADDWR